MKKHLRLNALMAAAVIAVLPSISSANTISFSGSSLASGETANHAFAVTNAGIFNFSTLNGFFFRLFNSTGDSITGLIAGNFNDTLGTGSYSVGLTNLFGFTTGYSITIASTRGTAVAAVPEPTTITMLGAGLLGLAWLRRRRVSSLG
jgi:hypothetical protein